MPLFKGSPTLDQMSEKINDLLEEGMLLKVDWNELKQRINRHFEVEWKRTVNNQCYGSDEPMSRDLLSINYPMLHTLNSTTKKLDKAIKDHPESPLVRVAKAGQNLVEEMQVFAPNMETLKGMIKTSKDIKEAKNPRPMPKIDPKAKEMIKGAMEGITEGIRGKAFEQNKAFQLRVVALYEDRVAKLPEGKSDSPYRVFRYEPDYQHLLGRLYTSDRFNGAHRRIDDFEALIDKNANQGADFVRDVFVNKQLTKLPAIATALGNIKSIKGDLNLRGNIEASLRLEFEEGSSFNVITKVVFATSVNGKFYSRYPTTFHDVIDKEGNKVASMLSEDEMHEFAGVEPLSDSKTNDGP